MPNKDTIKKMGEMLSVGLMAMIADCDFLTEDEADHLQALAYRLQEGIASDEDWIETLETLVPMDTEMMEERL